MMLYITYISFLVEMGKVFLKCDSLHLIQTPAKILILYIDSDRYQTCICELYSIRPCFHFFLHSHHDFITLLDIQNSYIAWLELANFLPVIFKIAILLLDSISVKLSQITILFICYMKTEICPNCSFSFSHLGHLN